MVGSPTEDEIYLSVGRALHAWETVEEELALIFGALVGAEDTVASMRAYGSVITSRGRNEMVSAAAGAYFLSHPHPFLESRFRSVMPAVQGYGARRNDLAHGILRTIRNGEGYVLTPSAYMTQKVKHFVGLTYAYNAAHIDAFFVDFLILRDELSDLTFYMQVFNSARRAYGGMLTPSQIVRLDWLLRFPTLQIPKAQPQPSEA